MRTYMILTIAILLLLSACGKVEKEDVIPGTERFRCDDGRLVTDENNCEQPQKDPEPSIDPTTPSVPSIVEIEQTEQPVASETDARDAFSTYILENALDYEIESVVDEGAYYRVIYSYTERGGGKHSMLVDNDGNIMVELPRA
jgi:hypothetical protein